MKHGSNGLPFAKNPSVKSHELAPHPTQCLCLKVTMAQKGRDHVLSVLERYKSKKKESRMFGRPINLNLPVTLTSRSS